MSRPLRCQDLPAAGQQLVALMQRIQFGRLESLQVHNGTPLLDPGPVIIRDYKFGSEEVQRPAGSAPDFLLKQQVVELFDSLQNINHGTIDVLEIRHGLPFRMIRKETV